MKITESQIQELYQFVATKKVKHYDLQTELVDHLANGVEECWEKNPMLTFHEALNMEFKKFGTSEFNKIIKKHQKVLEKKYSKIIKSYIYEYFKLPKIIGTFTAIIALFYLIRYVSFGKWIMDFVFMFFILYMLLSFFQLMGKYKRKVKKTSKCWKLEEMIFKSGNGFSLMLLIPQVIYQTGMMETENYYLQMLISILIVFTIVLAHITIHILPKKASKLLHEIYPEYELLH